MYYLIASVKPKTSANSRARRQPYYTAIILLLFLCSGCGSNKLDSSLQQQAEQLMKAPQAPVKFLFSVDPYPASTIVSLELICVEISQGPIMERGDQSDKLYQHISSHLQLNVDNRQVQFTKRMGFATEFGDPSYGTFGGAITACAPVKLSDGLHLATVQTASTSGMVYSYTWAFRIDSNVAKDYATMVKSTVDPFSR